VEAHIRATYDREPQYKWDDGGRCAMSYEECYGRSPLEDAEDVEEAEAAIHAFLEACGATVEERTYPGPANQRRIVTRWEDFSPGPWPPEGSPEYEAAKRQREAPDAWRSRQRSDEQSH